MKVPGLLTLSLCGALSLPGMALAQSSTGAPAGRDPATAPGGTEGIAGPCNEGEAVRDGDTVAVPPGRGGVEVDALTSAMERMTPTSRP